MGLTQPRALQVNDLDEGARTALWNLVYFVFFDESISERMGAIEHSVSGSVHILWTRGLGQLAHAQPTDPRALHDVIFRYFCARKWDHALDFIELCAKVSPLFANSLNSVLESENVAYRLVGKEIVPLTNAAEIAEIEAARARTGATNPLAGARAHIDSALEKLGQRPTPDVRNAIKEAISAVEVVARQVAGEGDTLGAALKRLDVDMSPALKVGLEKLYGWTNGPDGIRHAMMTEPNLGVEDARFMVVTCSAFVNYLIVKADRAGIRF